MPVTWDNVLYTSSSSINTYAISTWTQEKLCRTNDNLISSRKKSGKRDKNSTPVLICWKFMGGCYVETKSTKELFPPPPIFIFIRKSITCDGIFRIFICSALSFLSWPQICRARTAKDWNDPDSQTLPCRTHNLVNIFLIRTY